MTGHEPGLCAEGATGVPSTVFVYPFTCRLDGRHYRCDPPHVPSAYARNLKRFGDLVRILRELAKDAGSCVWPVTIPGSALTGNGLGRASLADALARGER